MFHAISFWELGDTTDDIWSFVKLSSKKGEF